MKYVLSALALIGALSVPLSAPLAATGDVTTYIEGNYRYTCIEKEDLRYCGNWNVVTPLPAGS